MNEAEGTTVIIVGAGCSCDYGYPLAAKTREHLEKFAIEVRKVGQGNTSLLACVENTLKSFDLVREKNPKVGSLDEFVHAVNDGRRNNPRADETVHNAKCAVAALFLHQETAAASTGLQVYHNLLRRVFPASLGSWQNRFRKTPYRILSFNYDRLFEIAFRQLRELRSSRATMTPTRSTWVSVPTATILLRWPWTVSRISSCTAR